MKHITIEEKERPIHLGVYGLSEFTEISGVKINEIDTVLTGDATLMQMLQLFFIMLKEGAIQEKQRVDFTVRDVAAWIEKDETIITKLLTALPELMPQLRGNVKAPEAKPGSGT